MQRPNRIKQACGGADSSARCFVGIVLRSKAKKASPLTANLTATCLDKGGLRLHGRKQDPAICLDMDARGYLSHHLSRR